MDNVFGKRLAAARRRRGLKQVELAAVMGEKYDQSTISAVERGRSGLRADGLVSAVRELRISTDYLYGLADDSREVSELLGELGKQVAGGPSGDSGTSEAVGVVELAAMTGVGARDFDEVPLGRAWMSRAWFVRNGVDPDSCFLVSVSGRSMEPALAGGSSILVDCSDVELSSDNIYVFMTSEGLVVRRALWNREGWWLVADGVAAPMLLSEDDDVIGRVRRVMQDL